MGRNHHTFEKRAKELAKKKKKEEKRLRKLAKKNNPTEDGEDSIPQEDE